MNIFSNFSSLIARNIPFVNNALYMREHEHPTKIDVSGSTATDYSNNPNFHSHAHTINNGTSLLVKDADSTNLDVSEIIKRKNEISFCVKYNVHDIY